MGSRRIEGLIAAILILAGAIVFHGLRTGPTAAASEPGGAAMSSQPAAPAQATPVYAIARSFTYQGVLRSASGTPLNGNYNMGVAIYATESGGTALYTETFSGVQVRNGLFTLSLGLNTPLGDNLFTDAPRYLGITIAPDPELMPRTRIQAAPYAIAAGIARTLPAGATVNGPNSLAQFGLSNGIGVFGRGGPGGDGVYGENDDGYGVYGRANVTGTGVAGWSESGDGVYGFSKAGGSGVSGGTTAGTGVFGFSETGAGVEGHSVDGRGVSANSVNSDAVYGKTSSNANAGILGENEGDGPAVKGVSLSGNGIGVWGKTVSNSAIYGETVGGDAITAVTTSGHALRGISNSSSGVFGSTQSGVGVRGYSNTNVGVMGVNERRNTIGYLGTDTHAGYFTGNVHVAGTLSKSLGSFRIDHPLDPANRTLSHSFVESPDMMNIYNGNAMLDKAGEVWVTLPDWFEALNRDYRYQLTAIGAPSPNLYVAEEVKDGRFKIAGGVPGSRVSWQVTGIRQDPYARAHPIIVEEDKPPSERGLYLNPEVYGQPASDGVADAMRQKAEGGGR